MYSQGHLGTKLSWGAWLSRPSLAPKTNHRLSLGCTEPVHPEASRTGEPAGLGPEGHQFWL